MQFAVALRVLAWPTRAMSAAGWVRRKPRVRLRRRVGATAALRVAPREVRGCCAKGATAATGRHIPAAVENPLPLTPISGT